ncbi:YigZ family protein [Anaerosalibacter bizertensis]|nr:YigZ family protein [Anaerosalibacter bizertensis]MBV1817910.1 YigZ family protein [Bacteroidales bacterium MSK.15.36]MCB5559471.1 YigZ family protein [Anaerosalibacter bizertensis]MCG4583571.1 YigZ family protein [Anaerosalibacter bizertensis]MCG4585562.1 YigZ family protein [Anaerosalibacter bizertensis]MSS43251.1 YigZ family protein [Anaerosalibacter bizertensis]
MKTRYRTIYKMGEDEILIKKSRFIGYAMPVETEDEAIKFIEEIKTKHRDATHNVYAYVLGEDNNIQRYSDDGEPSGTAGIPALEVIKKEDLRNVAVVVTRYFGGKKLGTGGLIRAYTKGAKIGLEAGVIIDKILFRKVKVRIDYTLYGMVENYLINKGIYIEDTIFDDAVNLILYIEYEKDEKFRDTIRELTNGTGIIDDIGEEYLSISDGKILK